MSSGTSQSTAPEWSGRTSSIRSPPRRASRAGRRRSPGTSTTAIAGPIPHHAHGCSRAGGSRAAAAASTLAKRGSRNRCDQRACAARSEPTLHACAWRATPRMRVSSMRYALARSRGIRLRVRPRAVRSLDHGRGAARASRRTPRGGAVVAPARIARNASAGARRSAIARRLHPRCLQPRSGARAREHHRRPPRAASRPCPPPRRPARRAARDA